MDQRIVEEARFVAMAKVRQARGMTAEERVLAGPLLFADVCLRMKEGLRHEFPGSSEDELHQLLLRRLEKLRKLDDLRRIAS